MQSDVERLLQEFGLSPYEAKAYTSLISLGHATARELSERASIPRTKIYEVLEKLEIRGFVEKQPSNPLVFKALDPEKTIGSLQRNLIEKSQKCLEALEKIKAQKSNELSFVWITRSRFGAEMKLRDLVENSKDLIMALFDDEFKNVVNQLDKGRILLFEKFPIKNANFRIVDRSKITKSEFLIKFIELVEGLDIDGINLRLSTIAVSEKESLAVVKEKEGYIAINARFPLIIFLQRSLLETLWKDYCL